MSVRLLVLFSLLVVFGLLQYRLWLGDGSLGELAALSRQIEAQRLENEQLKTRNAQLEAEVSDLKEGLDAVEERARQELGMVKKGETFFMVVEE